MLEFLAMGGYAEFVWPCYAAVLGGMAWMLVSSMRRARSSEREAQALRALSPRRRRSSGS